MQYKVEEKHLATVALQRKEGLNRATAAAFVYLYAVVVPPPPQCSGYSIDTTGYSQTAVEYRLVIQQVTVFCKRREGASNSTSSVTTLLASFSFYNQSNTCLVTLQTRDSFEIQICTSTVQNKENSIYLYTYIVYTYIYYIDIQYKWKGSNRFSICSWKKKIYFGIIR